MPATKPMHWTQTREGRKRQSKRMKAQHKNSGLKKPAEVVAHIEPKIKTGMLYTVSIKPQHGITEIELQDVPRREVLGLIGRLMKGK